jgi:uncharacterized protein
MKQLRPSTFPAFLCGLLRLPKLASSAGRWTCLIPMLLTCILCGSCATYYQKNLDFNTEFQRGNLDLALQTLQHQDNQANGRARFIYYANNGLLLSVMGRYTESNDYLEKAYLFGEDYRINYLNETVSYLTNPNVVVYRGEDHEHLMVLYFKALNFLKMNKKEEALVECRRLNIRLNQLTDRYSSPEKYQRDAFIHTLMGIIFQSDNDYNNAFIAYRNALEVYEGDYARMFSVTAPEQLKKDLLDAAWKTGFVDEFERYKEHFGWADYKPDTTAANLVFFWHNGLSPVKDEWSINFVITPGPDNVFVFANAGMNISFPFRVDNEKDRADLTKLQVFRVAFPRYTERPALYQSAGLKLGGTSFPLELAEDVNKIAYKCLNERMMLELGKGLLRAALKKTTEQSLRKENEGLGALLGMVNAITEKADTRNWQTLPHSIYYTRVPLVEGANDVKFSLQNVQGSHDYSFTYKATKGQTLFHTFSSLETAARPYRYN